MDAEEVADRIELSLLLGQANSVASERVSDFIENAAGLSRPAVELGLNAIRRRQTMLAELYPFRIGNVGIQRVPSEVNVAYRALLAMSYPGSLTDPPDSLAVAFERLVVTAAPRIFGSEGVAIRFAWPSETQPPRPADFPGAVRWLADRMGVPVGSGYRPPRRQDGGVDVVAWRPFPDLRPGFPVLLIQATVQHDYIAKSRDIDLRLWSTWLAWDVEPMTALAIPYMVTKSEDWNEMSRRTTVLDRVRLCSLLVGDMPASIADWAVRQVDAEA